MNEIVYLFKPNEREDCTTITNPPIPPTPYPIFQQSPYPAYPLSLLSYVFFAVFFLTL